MGEGSGGGFEASEETARKIQVRGDDGLNLEGDISQCYI